MGLKDKKAAAEYNREYRRKNADKVKEICRIWRIKNPDSSLKASRRWREKHPEKVAIAQKRYMEAHPGERLDKMLQREYGISIDQFNAMLLIQNGVCKICKRPPSGRWKRLHVDHDHVTGKVRGLLCSPCNLVLGQVDDNIDHLKAAISYLEETR